MSVIVNSPWPSETAVFPVGCNSTRAPGSTPCFASVTRPVIVPLRSSDIASPDVARIIEKHVDCTEEPWDWDEFTTRPIANNHLNQIRIQCAGVAVPAF